MRGNLIVRKSPLSVFRTSAMRALKTFLQNSDVYCRSPLGRRQYSSGVSTLLAVDEAIGPWQMDASAFTAAVGSVMTVKREYTLSSAAARTARCVRAAALFAPRGHCVRRDAHGAVIEEARALAGPEPRGERARAMRRSLPADEPAAEALADKCFSGRAAL